MVPPPIPASASSSGDRPAWVVDAGWVTRVSGPPSEVASWASSVPVDELAARLAAPGDDRR